jgi:lipoate-protein ligase A
MPNLCLDPLTSHLSPLTTVEWRVLVETDRDVAEQMVYDEQLAREGLPTIRLFTWKAAAISRGYKQPPPDWLTKEHGGWRMADCGLSSHSIQHPTSNIRNSVTVVERPTGGGMAFHGSDVCVAVVVPPSLGMALAQVMGWVCGSAVAVCRAFGVDTRALLDAHGEGRAPYCLTEPTVYSVVAKERKLAGFAIRRYRESWLIQGSLLVRPLPDALRRALPPAVNEALEARALSLAEAAACALDEQDVLKRWATEYPEVGSQKSEAGKSPF